MRHLGSIEGRGELRDGDDVLGAVRYQIDVWQSGNSFKSADGKIEADLDLIERAFGLGNLTLILKDGNTILIAIKSHNSAENEAEITVSGAVPGF